jgi:hypothetical protein
LARAGAGGPRAARALVAEEGCETATFGL